MAEAKPVLSLNLETARPAIAFLGIPGHLVDQVILNQRLDAAAEFTNIQELFLAVDDVAQSPHKQASLARKLYLADEEQRKKRKEEKENRRLSEAIKKKRRSAGKVLTDRKSLLEKIYALARQNSRLRERKMCKKCKKVELAASGITFLPCGHFITCEQCSEKIDNCLACGQDVLGSVCTFLS